MSLHNASKYLASKGRKGDTELVHMTKGEVRGLQQLALAHGGSLTINPETGLVEAGWLKTILPMVAGAALTVATGGTALAAYAPLMAAALAGGGMYAATGSVKEGLMAGLGAYGGAGLTSGVMAAGAEAASAEAIAAETARQGGIDAATQATAEAAGQQVGQESARQMGLNAAEQAAQESAQMQSMTQQGLTFNQQQNILQGVGQTGAPVNPQLQGASAYPNISGEQYSNIVQQGTGSNMTTEQINNALAKANAANTGTPANYSFNQNLTNAGKGLSSIGNVVMENPKPAMALGLAAFQGAQSSGVSGFPPNQSSNSGPSSFNASVFQPTQPTPPNPAYSAQYQDYRKRGLPAYQGYAGGGVVAMADGGMQDPMNPIQNPVYPQSQQEHTNFATSTQYPNSIKSAMASDYDARTNPQTGEELPMGMAEGGVARYDFGGTTRQLQPGGTLGDWHGKTYGAISNATGVDIGGWGGNLTPGANQYHDQQAAKQEEEASKQREAQAQQQIQQEFVRRNTGMQQSIQAQQPQQGGLGAFQSYAQGGVIGMASGTPKTLSRSPGMPDGGIYRDTDPDTASKDAYQAALIRMQKVNKAAGLKAASMPKARMDSLMGAISTDDMAGGGIAHYSLGGYSDGGRMLKGPGDGMSDSIPASIGGRQAARLADGEFVVPADVVSHLGNGSTDAGAKKLYGMMDKVRKARTGTKKQGKQINADKFTPK